MANEINFSASIGAVKAGASISVSASKSLTMTGTDMVQQTQNIIHTDAVALDLGNVTGQPAALMVKNLSTANFVELALDEPMTNKIAKLLPGTFALIPLPPATIYAQADTATVAVLVAAVEA